MPLETRESPASRKIAALRAQVDEIMGGLDQEVEALAKAVAERLVPNSPAAAVAKAADEAAEDRLAAKIAKAMQPSAVEKACEAEGVDPRLAGMFGSLGRLTAAERLAKALEVAPTLEDLRKSCEAEGVDPALAGIFEPTPKERLSAVGL